MKQVYSARKQKGWWLQEKALKSDTGLEFSLYHCCPPCDIGPNLSNIQFPDLQN